MTPTHRENECFSFFFSSLNLQHRQKVHGENKGKVWETFTQIMGPLTSKFTTVSYQPDCKLVRRLAFLFDW